MRLYAAAFTVLMLLGGCSATVRMIEPNEIAGFEVGKTNQTEVAAALGKPVHTITEADGSKIDQYAYAGGASGGGIIPSFLGGGPSRENYGMISFKYGSGGILKEIVGAK